MTAAAVDPRPAALRLVREQLQEATRASKCHGCGCLQQTITALDATSVRADLADVIAEARATFVPKRYDCLGCAVCWPAVAANAFDEAFPGEGGALDLCPTAPPVEREDWPPLPGDYRVVHADARVAVCTLNNQALADALSTAAPAGLAIVGTLHTENLGIERLIRNLVSNPRIRSLILCGDDTQQAIGHLPGQSLMSLFASGIDPDGRIRGAAGKRPVLKNVSRAQIEAFVSQVSLTTMIGETDPTIVTNAVRAAARFAPAEATASVVDASAPIVRAAAPTRLISDPAGYFVVYPDRRRHLLLVEHYTNAGVLDVVIEGATPAALFATIIERGLVSRLDHAAYLGRELGRAERALETSERYIQDRAAGDSTEDLPPVVDGGCECPGTCSTGGDR